MGEDAGLGVAEEVNGLEAALAHGEVEGGQT